jgi:hypothetical protein
MDLNPDFSDLLSAFSDAEARFLVVGAYATILYTAPRFTKDLDIWIDATPENAERVYRALQKFGAPLADLKIEDLSAPETVFQIGVEPNRIDIVTSIDAVLFADAWSRRTQTSYGSVPIPVIGFDDLLKNKRAVGRAQDLLDVEQLEKARR